MTTQQKLSLCEMYRVEKFMKKRTDDGLPRARGRAIGRGCWWGLLACLFVCLLLFLRDERNVPGCDSADGGTSL